MSNDDSSDASANWQNTALQHLDALYGYAMTLTHNPAESEDLVQETYLQAMQHFAQLRPDSNLKAWLFTISRNTWLKTLRHARAGPAFVGLDESDAKQQVSDVDDPPTQLFRIWERGEVRTAIAALPRECREIIILRDFEGFSYKELAEMLECPIGTVMSRLARARAKLKKVLCTQQPSILSMRNG